MDQLYNGVNMKNLVNTLENLKATSKISEKTALLETIQDPTIKRVLNFLGDPNQVVGISTKKLQKNIEPIPHTLSFSELLDYLLVHNTGTENEIGMALYTINQYDQHTQDVLRQIIGKSWTTTVGAALLNKVFGDNFIDVFSVQLAYPYEKKINGYSDDTYFFVTQKLDGFRAVVEVNKGKVISVKTRKGKAIDGLTELKTDIESVLNNTSHMVFDGELLLEDTDENLTSVERFQKTGQQLSAEGECQNIGFNIFDALPYHEFKQGISERSYKERRELYLAPFTAGRLVRVLPILGHTTKHDIHKWSDYATEHGFEGVMLNDPDAKYETKRVKGLLKVKKMHTADLPIVGFEEAIDGKNRGGLRSLIVQLDDENTVNVASGLTEQQREHIWNNRQDYLGRIIEVQYFEETRNKNGGRSLRFPVVRSFRDDKTIEDINVD